MCCFTMLSSESISFVSVLVCYILQAKFLPFNDKMEYQIRSIRFSHILMDKSSDGMGLRGVDNVNSRPSVFSSSSGLAPGFLIPH